jgi:hypothetical protein
VPMGGQKMCQIVPCQRLAQYNFGELKVCGTHWRIFTVGEFGDRAKPPWTRDEARKALIEQDGLDAVEAEKRIAQWFDRRPRGPA